MVGIFAVVNLCFNRLVYFLFVKESWK